MPSRHRSRLAGDDGTALVESAFILPVMLTFLLGIFELGYVYKDYQAVENATQQGIRSSSIAGNVVTADYEILTSLKQGGSALSTGDVNRVVIFKAFGATSTVPAPCKTSASGLVGNLCNVYYPADFNRPKAEFDCSTGSAYEFSSPSRYWCPDSRKTAALADLGNGPPDWIGVYMSVEHRWLTRMFASTTTIEETSITRLEPATRT